MAVPPIVAFQFKMMALSYSGIRPDRESRRQSEGSRVGRGDASKKLEGLQRRRGENNAVGASPRGTSDTSKHSLKVDVG